MKINDQITFGTYDWIVLDIKEDKALIITKDIIEQRTYHDKYIDITWNESELRIYLNDSFYNGFNNLEKQRIVKVTNKNPNNEWYNTNGGVDTEDFVFCLSTEEACTYFGNSTSLLYNPSKNQRYWFQRKDINNQNRRSTYLGYVWWYWLRSPGRLSKSAVYVHGDGNIGIQGNNVGTNKYNTLHPITKTNIGGVRPALWIRI